MFADFFERIAGRFLLWYRKIKNHRSICRNGYKSKTVRFEGIKIHYYRSADSHLPTLVLLHGFLDSSHTFRRLLPELKNRYSVYCIDIPGFGLSHMPYIRELWHIDRISAILFRFCSQFLELSRANFLTHSMGGLIAVHMYLYEKKMQQKQELFKDINMIAPGLFFSNRTETLSLRKRLYPGNSREAEDLLQSMFNTDRNLPLVVLAGLIDMWQNKGYEYLADNTLERLEDIFFKPAQLKSLKLPATLYWCEKDQILPARFFDYGKKAGIKTVELTQCPHCPQFEFSDVVLTSFYENS